MRLLCMYIYYLAAGSCHCLCMKISLANPDSEVRSSGTIACGVMHLSLCLKFGSGFAT